MEVELVWPISNHRNEKKGCTPRVSAEVKT